MQGSVSQYIYSSQRRKPHRKQPPNARACSRWSCDSGNYVLTHSRIFRKPLGCRGAFQCNSILAGKKKKNEMQTVTCSSSHAPALFIVRRHCGSISAEWLQLCKFLMMGTAIEVAYLFKETRFDLSCTAIEISFFIIEIQYS